MDNQYTLMAEYFTLRAEKKRLAEEFRALMEPLQSRQRAIEAQLEDGCDANCSTCTRQEEQAPLAIRIPRGRAVN